jgi:hypothetical protein
MLTAVTKRKSENSAGDAAQERVGTKRMWSTMKKKRAENASERKSEEEGRFW